MVFSFRLAAVKGLRKKKVRSKAYKFEVPRRRRRAMDSKSSDFEKIPEHLFMDILARLPAKLVTRLKCISKLWYSVISSRLFTNFYLESPSSAQRRRLFMSFVDKEDKKKHVFVSSSSPHDQLDEDLNLPGMGGHLVNALRGLICVSLGRRVRICNLTTKQRVTFPKIRSRIVAELNNDNICNFFGYDLVHDEYKVLSTVWEVDKEGIVVRSEHQVLVLAPGASWRNTQSSHTQPPPPHRPYPPGIFINGVLYYGACMDKNRFVVVSFDLISEEFNLIEFPVEAGIIWNTSHVNLINYKDKLAVIEYSRLVSDATVDLWVIGGVGMRKWSNTTLVLPLSQMNFVHGHQLWIQGTSHRSEVRLGTTKPIPTQPRRYVTYDLENNKLTRSLEVKPLIQIFLLGLRKTLVTTFWEHIDSINMYLDT